MKLSLESRIKLLSMLSNDFARYAKLGIVPSSKEYKIPIKESRGIKQSARIAAFNKLEELGQPLKKLAFDTRRVDQENERNPRKNLQYWHRSDPFIDADDEDKLKTFAKLTRVVSNMKDNLGTYPEWFESYARQLYDNLNRILRVKQADLDIFRPQLSYLEQLIYARYRLSMDNIRKFSEKDLEDRILAKDEELIGRNNYLKATQTDDDKIISRSDINPNFVSYSDYAQALQMPVQPQQLQPQPQPEPTEVQIAKSIQSSSDSLLGSLFGNVRKDGEKEVERVITISFKDKVLEKEG